MKIVKLTAGLLVVVSLAGCANMGPNQTAGTLIGGAAGGLLGSTIGQGGGRTAATIIGAVGGSMIGSSVGQSMDYQQGYYGGGYYGGGGYYAQPGYYGDGYGY